MSCTAGAFGSGAYGSLGFGSGSILELASARAVSANAVEATFSVPVYALDRATFWDALNPANWSITSFNPYGSTVRLAQYVEKISSTVVRILFDGPLDPNAEYTLISQNLRDATGGAMSLGCGSAVFTAFDLARPVVQAAPGREIAADLANPWGPLDDGGDNLGTYQITTQGDLAVDSGRVYLRKRVLRRATTAFAGFFHLPQYGFGLEPKGVVRPAMLRAIQSRAQVQILQEPDVVACSVAVQQLESDPSIVVLTIRVRDTYGNTETVTAPVPFGG